MSIKPRKFQRDPKPDSATELLDRRTVCSKLYELGNGQFRREVGRVPMHFERNGQMLDIDLIPEDDGVDHAIRNCPYSLKIAKNEPAYAYNALNGKRVSVELVSDARGSLYDDGLFKWAEVGRDTDYVIQPLPVGVTTLLILQTPDAPRRWTWEVQGDISMIQPMVGTDAAGRLLELVETRDQNSISVEWTGRALVPRILRTSRENAWSENVTYPVIIDPTVNENVAASADDVYSYWINNGATFGALNANPLSTLSVGRYATFRAYAGVRFQTVGVPASATINSATLTVRATGVTGTPDLNIYGVAADSAAVWADPGNRIKNISKTTAVTNKSTWTSDADNSIDVQSIVAEIVARAGWASNNNMAFGLFNNAGAGNHLLSFAALDHATLTEARLAIDYTEAGAGGGGRKQGRGLTQSVLLKPRALIN